MEQFEYIIDIDNVAKEELLQHKKAGNKVTIKRIERIFSELANIPFTGIGNPHPLKYELTGYWARDINQKDRLIYRVDEVKKTVFVTSAMGHYE